MIQIKAEFICFHSSVAHDGQAVWLTCIKAGDWLDAGEAGVK